MCLSGVIATNKCVVCCTSTELIKLDKQNRVTFYTVASYGH